MKEAGKQPVSIQRVRKGARQERSDVVAVEEPLEIQVQEEGLGMARPVSVTMRTPGQDAALALGFLWTEGLIRHPQDVLQVSVPGDNQVCVHLASGGLENLASAERNFYTTSSCGVCGKSSIDAIRTQSRYDLRKNHFSFAEIALFSLTKQLDERQTLFAETGGIHAATLFDRAGQFLRLQEDVGRHNALDKLIGDAIQNDDLPLEETILLLSGRASFELVQKAAMAGIPVIVAIGAPSSLAVELARETGQTLIGFLRQDGYNCYAGHERIQV